MVTYDVDDHLLELDRASVIAGLMLGAVFQGKSASPERIPQELRELREKRKKEVGSSVFVIFEAVGEIQSFNQKHQTEFPEFAIAIDGAPKEEIRFKYQQAIRGLLASFALASDRIVGVHMVKDGVVFFDEGDKPVYSYTFKASGSAIVSTGMKEGVLDFVKNNAKLLSKHQDLVDSARLLAKSLDEEADELLSFLSVWFGLEIFVEKNFKHYEKIVFNNFGYHRGEETPLSKFLGRIKDVMEVKYNVTDKFIVICFQLAPESPNEDIKTFERIKDIRNRIMHGKDVAFSSLPTEDTGKLLRKYLKLHVERK